MLDKVVHQDLSSYFLVVWGRLENKNQDKKDLSLNIRRNILKLMSSLLSETKIIGKETVPNWPKANKSRAKCKCYT